MCRYILIKELFDDICDIARINFTWEPQDAPHDFLVKQDDG